MTNKVRADTAAIQKMTKLEWRTKIELESSVANQFDMRNTRKMWIKQETKKSFSQLINSVYLLGYDNL